MIDVQVRRVLVEEESARAPGGQCDRALHVCVVLHILWTEYAVTCLTFCERDLVAEEWVGEEIEVIAVSGLVIDAAVAFVTIQVNQIGVVLAIVETVGGTGVALLEQKGDMSRLHLGDGNYKQSKREPGECSLYRDLFVTTWYLTQVCFHFQFTIK